MRQFSGGDAAARSPGTARGGQELSKNDKTAIDFINLVSIMERVARSRTERDFMHVFSRPKLLKAASDYPDAATSLNAWFKIAERAHWSKTSTKFARTIPMPTRSVPVSSSTLAEQIPPDHPDFLFDRRIPGERLRASCADTQGIRHQQVEVGLRLRLRPLNGLEVARAHDHGPTPVSEVDPPFPPARSAPMRSWSGPSRFRCPSTRGVAALLPPRSGTIMTSWWPDRSI